MTTPAQTLEADIRGTEKAIRLLIGEQRAVTSKFSRAEALLKLERSRLAAVLRPHGPRSLAKASRFPDFSDFQVRVDLKAVRNGGSVRVGELAVTKLTEGLGFKARTGPDRLKTMAALKFPRRGAYHFGHATESGVAQAQFFLGYAHDTGISWGRDDIVVYDCEVTDGQSGRQVAIVAHDFAVEIRKHVPGEIWLYGGGPFLSGNGVTLDGYDAHWLAAYVSNPGPFKVFGARTKYWQYSDGNFGPQPHSCPGIGPSDMSVVL
jgi:lysozyme